ncbi:striated muscle preferentially expressed protein kinase [Platysternon megacephalum]|uniref:Striated muscle preferentially expressed protein kinase n=1 Tax=Platysternon megacephalum TaxID=55544 RepID=A0A4D9DL47_9SAUR|nr:striated muscle preferentially expressed protein kinase [Platysternon megacephalum]
MDPVAQRGAGPRLGCCKHSREQLSRVHPQLGSQPGVCWQPKDLLRVEWPKWSVLRVEWPKATTALWGAAPPYRQRTDHQHFQPLALRADDSGCYPGWMGSGSGLGGGAVLAPLAG